MVNYTVADLLQTTAASLAFALFLLPTGYLVGAASDCFGFRQRSASEKLLFSAAFSVAVVPIIAVLAGRFLSYTGALIIFLILLLVAAAHAIRKLPSFRFSQVERSTAIVAAMMLAWFVLVLLSTADLQFGNRLYVSYLTYDHAIRVPFVEAATRSVPPLNPFYGLEKVLLRYFYYWYVVCALPAKIFGLSARSCFNASTLWSCLALASLLPLFLKHFFGERVNLRRKSVIAIALLAVTGLDLIPYGILCACYHKFVPDMEWWDTSQVTSWLGSLLWVPHHVASMIACMAGLLMISTIEEEMEPRRRAWAVAIAGAAFASAAGLSLYVTFTFALFAILWSVGALMQKKLKSFFSYAVAGAISLLLSWPFLSDLLPKHAAGAAGTASSVASQFAFFAIRDNQYITLLLMKAGIESPLALTLLKLPALLLNFLLEFGFFAVIALIMWRRDRTAAKPLGRQRQMARTLFIVCLLAMSFLQSNATGSNDLGFRGILVVQFVLLLWAAPIVDEFFFAAPSVRSSRWTKITLAATMLLGMAATAWQLMALRVYLPLADSGKIVRSERFLGSPTGYASRTYCMRELYSRLDRLTTPAVRVQYNPVRDEVLLAQLYSTRQEVGGDQSCGSGFGGDGQKCREVLPYFAVLFNRPEIVRTWDVNSLCDAYSISVLVATDADPVWQDPASWVWQRSALVSTPEARAVTCGSTPKALAPR
jgi:hypothetical protein